VFILRWRSRFVRNSVPTEGGSWQLFARKRLDLAYIQRRGNIDLKANSLAISLAHGFK